MPWEGRCTEDSPWPWWCRRTTRSGSSGARSRRCRDFVDHIIVVDDASSDDTAEAAKAVGDSRTRVISLLENQGVGGAILTGHAEALALDADVSVVMAGDAQMDPDHLPALLDPIASGDAQFTKGNRFHGRGSFAGMPTHRIVGNIALSFLTKAASGYWNLFDPLNGYTAISREALQRLDLKQARPTLRVRERPAHPPQHPAGPRRRRADPCSVRRRGLGHQPAQPGATGARAPGPRASGRG